MLAAVVHGRGQPPAVVEDWPEPEPGPGQALVAVAAAALNPLDLALAAGAVPGAPDGPYVVGLEAAGRVLASDRVPAGTRVRIAGAPPSGGGCLAERVAVDHAALVAVPVGLSDESAAGLGVAGMAAWFALREKAGLRPGERVAVLGATGVVGILAVQLAKLLGAGVVVGAGRDASALALAASLGADRTVVLDPDADADAVAAKLCEAAGGRLDVVVDPLWGSPGLGGLRSLGSGGRHVNLGHAAGSVAPVAAADVRANARVLTGHASALVPADAARAAYETLAAQAAAGRLTLPCETVALRDVDEAWRRQAASPHAKLTVALAP